MAAVVHLHINRCAWIVLDINFPPEVSSTGLQWDGFNIMEWMRRFREVAEIPVIIITSGDPAKYKTRALAAGASAFFQKPINHEEFLKAVGVPDSVNAPTPPSVPPLSPPRAAGIARRAAVQ